MKKFKKKFIINIDVYGRKLHVVYNLKPKEIRDFIKNSEIEKKYQKGFIKLFKDDCVDGKGSHSSDGVNSIIYLCEHETISDLINTVSHEVGHYVFKMLKHLGMGLSYKSEEAFTYLIGYCNEEIFKELIEPLIKYNNVNNR